MNRSLAHRSSWIRTLALVAALLALTVGAVQAQPTPEDLQAKLQLEAAKFVNSEVAPTRGQGTNPSRFFGENVFSVGVSTPTGHILILGVDYLESTGTFWVTSGGATGSADPNFLFEVDTAGTVLQTVMQPNASAFGWRDFAYDGTFLYASDSAVLDQIDPATGTATGVTIPCPENPCRGLAYNPDTDTFFTANFGSPISEFDRMGNVVNTFPNTLAIYGMAWEPASTGTGGPWLWACSQDAPGVLLTQLDPATGMATGNTIAGDATGGGAPTAGGCDYTSDLVAGVPTIVAMHQADEDSAVAYDIDISSAPPSCDNPSFTTIFSEDFTAGIPGQFTVNDLGGSAGCVWNDDALDAGGAAAGPEGNLTGGAGNFADADSDECGTGSTMASDLVSPVINLSSATVGVQFNHDYRHLGTSSGNVEVSTDGGATWTTAQSFTADSRGPLSVFTDLSTAIGGAPSFQLRFRFDSPGWNWWWQVDDVRVCESGGANTSDMSVQKSGADNGDGTGTYVLTVSNAGPDDAPTVTVTDPLPAGVTYASDNCGGIFDAMTGIWTWTYGPHPVGAINTCVIEVTVEDASDTENTATVDGGGTDPEPLNNSSVSILGAPIPTASEIGLGILAVLMALGALAVLRRRF